MLLQVWANGIHLGCQITSVAISSLVSLEGWASLSSPSPTTSARGEQLDDLREHGGRYRFGISDRQLACGGVGEELDIPDALPQLIECHPAAREQSLSIERRLDTARTAIEELDAQSVLEIG